jgi:hypothetical protein
LLGYQILLGFLLSWGQNPVKRFAAVFYEFS